MPAIATEELTRRFGDVVAVEDVTMTVEDGEVFGFLGPNGAGKSTTINVLLGFIDPTSGEARVLDRDVTEQASDVRRRIGLLPEGFEAYRNLSAREHVQSAIDAKDANDDPDELLDRVGLDQDDASRPTKEYSTGMKQRTAMAIALVGEPDLLILDEPSSGLDPNGVKRLREIVREEAERGATVFFSSHVLDEVEKVCDRVGILSAGELVAVDSIDDLRSRLKAESTVHADLEPPAAELRGDALAMDDVEGVADVAVDGASVRVTCAEPRGKMRALRRLDDAATVVDVRIEDASLEAVFDQFTGGGLGRGPGESDDGGAGLGCATETGEGSADRAASASGGEP